jgi:hypothetical protein
MGELLPILGGCALGLGVASLRPRGRRWPWLLAGSVVVGILAGVVNGELSESAAFLLLDIPAALVSAAVVCRLRDYWAEGVRPWPQH